MLPYPPENIVPYFQPIIAADIYNVCGYEVLGRLIQDDRIISLGPFLMDSQIPDQIRLDVDRVVRKKALEYYAQAKNGKKLFINIKPAWIYEFLHCPDKIPTIRWMKEYNIPAENIVIEITEESFKGDLSQLAELLNHYRKIGCKIAIDDFGSNFSNFERIAYINPDIIKVDMQIVQKSAKIECYNELLKMISSFSQKIGADILFEGVEDMQQLYNCFKSSGRYFQGYLFSRESPSFEYNKSITTILYDIMLLQKNTEIASMSKRNSIRNSLNHIISQYLTKNMLPSNSSSFDAFLLEMTRELPYDCIKLFICDQQGWQTSSNIETTTSGEYRKVQRYRNINWSWRSYFLQTLVEIEHSLNGMITTPYRDIVTKEKIYTFSYPLDAHYILFIDILC